MKGYEDEEGSAIGERRKRGRGQQTGDVDRSIDDVGQVDKGVVCVEGLVRWAYETIIASQSTRLAECADVRDLAC